MNHITCWFIGRNFSFGEFCYAHPEVNTEHCKIPTIILDFSFHLNGKRSLSSNLQI